VTTQPSWLAGVRAVAETLETAVAKARALRERAADADNESVEELFALMTHLGFAERAGRADGAVQAWRSRAELALSELTEELRALLAACGDAFTRRCHRLPAVAATTSVDAILFHTPGGSTPWAAVPYNSLPEQHPLRTALAGQDCYQNNGVPVALLGSAEQDQFTSRWRPRAWYSVASAAGVTRLAAAAQREHEEQQRQALAAELARAQPELTPEQAEATQLRRRVAELERAVATLAKGQNQAGGADGITG
jgi:hypothetical protein